MKFILPDYTPPLDPHIPSESASFSALTTHYDGKTARWGDYHVHSASGGTSDGQTTPSEWLTAMDQLKIDFVGLMDHRQVRHTYLDEFTPQRFLYGTEPCAWWSDTDITDPCHYLMIFQNAGDLEAVLAQFPDVYAFEGGKEGHFSYIPMPYARFLDIVEAVRAIGGAFVNAHPKQAIRCDSIDAYYHGDRTVMEIVYTYQYPTPLNPHTQENYRLWLDLLESNKRVYNTATSDSHSTPTNLGINTVYTSEPICAEYVQKLREGNLNSGYIGIQMTLGNTKRFVPMGGTIAPDEDLELCIRIADGHPLLFGNPAEYRLDIYSDQGLAYSTSLTTFPYTCAILAKDRRFYRAEVIRTADGAPAAISNPIWIRV